MRGSRLFGVARFGSAEGEGDDGEHLKHRSVIATPEERGEIKARFGGWTPRERRANREVNEELFGRGKIARPGEDSDRVANLGPSAAGISQATFTLSETRASVL